MIRRGDYQACRVLQAKYSNIFPQMEFLELLLSVTKIFEPGKVIHGMMSQP